MIQTLRGDRAAISTRIAIAAAFLWFLFVGIVVAESELMFGWSRVRTAVIAEAIAFMSLATIGIFFLSRRTIRGNWLALLALGALATLYWT